VRRSVSGRVLGTVLLVLAGLTGCGGGGGGGGGVVPTATPGASSTPTPSGPIINEYPVSGSSSIADLTVGSDGALWFTDAQSNQFGRMTTSGNATEFPGPANGSPGNIVGGTNGTLWFDDELNSKIGVLSTAGSVTAEYQIPAAYVEIAFNRVDGRLWSVLENTTFQSSALYALNQVGQAFGPFPLPNTSVTVDDLMTDASGNLWFTESNVGKIGEANTSGTIVHEYQITTTSKANLNGLAMDTAGNVWYADGVRHVVGKLVPSTSAVTEYAIPQLPLEIISPGAVAVAPDGNVWATLDGQFNDDGLARVTPSGIVTEYAVSHGASPGTIVTGPDGNLWFAETKSIGELVLSSVP
jgi:virginiamycin B lyase